VAQALLQAPQCLLLRCASTQLVPHRVNPLVHSSVQTPLTHCSPLLHTLPQAPQLEASFEISVQLCAQAVKGVRQLSAQRPFWQV